MKERQKLHFQKLKKMMPEKIDELPGPAEVLGRRMRWVGFTWVDEGPADGTEPLLIHEDEDDKN